MELRVLADARSGSARAAAGAGRSRCAAGRRPSGREAGRRTSPRRPGTASTTRSVAISNGRKRAGSCVLGTGQRAVVAPERERHEDQRDEREDPHDEPSPKGRRRCERKPCRLPGAGRSRPAPPIERCDSAARVGPVYPPGGRPEQAPAQHGHNTHPGVRAPDDSRRRATTAATVVRWSGSHGDASRPHPQPPPSTEGNKDAHHRRTSVTRVCRGVPILCRLSTDPLEAVACRREPTSPDDAWRDGFAASGTGEPAVTGGRCGARASGSSGGSPRTPRGFAPIRPRRT